MGINAGKPNSGPAGRGGAIPADTQVTAIPSPVHACPGLYGGEFGITIDEHCIALGRAGGRVVSSVRLSPSTSLTLSFPISAE